MSENISSHHVESAGRPFLGLLVALIVIGYATIQFITPGTASLTLTFTDEHFPKNDMSGRSITVTARGRSFSFLSMESTAHYEGDVERHDREFVFNIDRMASGRRSLVINVEGYAVTSDTINLEASNSDRRHLVLNPEFGMVQAVVVDAQENVDISVQSTVTTNGDERPGAEALFTLAPGNHVVFAKSPGYCGGSRETFIEARKTSYPRILVSREVRGPVVVRAVLEWGRAARDLDAHVIISDMLAAVDNRHIYHADMSANILTGGIMAELHRDDRLPEGVEVISIYSGARGVVGYYVHVFEGGKSLVESGVLVKLLREDCQSQEYRMPQGCAADLWHVFNLRIDAAGVEVDSVNRCVDQPEYSKWRRLEKMKK
jgi:hypothetical protein